MPLYEVGVKSMDKKDLEPKIREAGFIRSELIGYQIDKNNGYIFPIFKPADNPHDEPTCGGAYYYYLKTRSWEFMTLLDIIDLDLETIMY